MANVGGARAGLFGGRVSGERSSLIALCMFLMAVALVAGVLANAAVCPETAEAKGCASAEKKIAAALSKGKTTVVFGKADKLAKSKGYSAFFKVLHGSADYMIREKSVTMYSYAGSKYVHSFKIRYRSAAQRRKLGARLNEVTSKALQAGADAEKVRVIHDAINAGCEYDWISYNTKRYSANCGEAYGALVEGKAVCAGYAKAFQIAALKSGLESVYVSNSNHAWNLVKVDGSWYHIDLTWDDCRNDFKYFLKGNVTMSETGSHVIAEYRPSKATASDADYAAPGEEEGELAEPGDNGAAVGESDDPLAVGADAGSGGPDAVAEDGRGFEGRSDEAGPGGPNMARNDDGGPGEFTGSGSLSAKDPSLVSAGVVNAPFGGGMNI